MTNLQTLSREQLEAMVAKYQASSQRKLALKVTAPTQRKDGTWTSGGAVSLYGLGRFPVTLYRSQWERIIDNVDDIKAFIEANTALLSVKD